jgi:branched-chain amino acid aminotransferase
MKTSSSRQVFMKKINLNSFLRSIKKCYSNTFKASEIQYNLRKTPLPKPDYSKPLGFGTVCTDHMMIMDFDVKTGWSKPIIEPFGDFKIDPRNSTLHYGIELFEGLKAYRNEEKVYIYRPDLNMKRMNNSAARVGLPPFNADDYLECLDKFLKLEQDWVHNERGFSLYIRPTYISMTNKLGVNAPTKARIFTILSPVGPYFQSGMTPIPIICNPEDYIRAGKGGFGDCKLGA